MENVEAEFGSSTGEDDLQSRQPAHSQEDGHRERVDPIFTEIVSFTSVSFLCTLALVNRLLQIFLNFQSSIHDFQSEFSNEDTTLFTSRKRRRDDWPTGTDEAHHFLQLTRSFALLHRHITSPWYIKPRAQSWSHLFLDFVPEDDP